LYQNGAVEQLIHIFKALKKGKQITRNAGSDLHYAEMNKSGYDIQSIIVTQS